MPPMGGELAMEILPLLDFGAIKNAKPKWLVGYSDVSTIACALTAKCNWATVDNKSNVQQLCDLKLDFFVKWGNVWI